MSDVDEEAKAVALENKSVHRVYDIIASHFSDTRYKARALPPRQLTIAMAPRGKVLDGFE